jgi:hypothetical protein
LVDISDEEFYVIDVFRVVGGSEHTKFIRSHFGTITTTGVPRNREYKLGGNAQMRGTRGGPADPGWSVDWRIDDKRGYLPDSRQIHLRYTDLTTGAEAYTGESWISMAGFSENEEVWIPHVVTRRTGAAEPLESAFVSVIEPYEGDTRIDKIRRVTLLTDSGQEFPESNVALEITLRDGRSDYFVAMDIENPLEREPAYDQERAVVIGKTRLVAKGEFAFARVSIDRKVVNHLGTVTRH